MTDPKDTSIRAIRQAKGMTLQDVADRLGTTAVTVSRWEREPSRVTIPVLNNLAVALDCTREELLGATAANQRTDNQEAFTAAVVLLGEYFGVDPANVAFLTKATDIMEPTIMRGERVYLDTSVSGVDHAGMYAMRQLNEARVVRIHRLLQEPGLLRVTADNKAYSIDYVVESDKVEIIGRVLGALKKF